MTTLKLIAPLMVFIGLSACVPVKQHRALEADLVGLEEQLSAEEEARLERERELDRQAALVEELNARIDALQQSVERKQAALDEAIAKEAAHMADKGRLKADVEAMKEALAELQARREAAEVRLQEYQNLLSRFQKLIDAGKLRVKIVDGRMVVELATDVLFASGSADLSEDGRASIKEVAEVLATIPDRAFQVEGHTDDVPIQTAQYPSNWELAAARSITVVQTMVSAGMPPERISAASYAENRPVETNESKEGKAANRRIEIVVVPDLSDLPGHDELEAMGGEASGEPPQD